MKPIKSLYILALITLTQANLNAQWVNIYNYNNTALYAIECINEDTVFVAGNNSTILRTFDKGQTWQTIDPGFEIHAKDINFPDAQIGYIVGASGRIAKTSDYGNNWELMITDTIYRLEKAEFIHPDTGWIIGTNMGLIDGIILKTVNGGLTWEYYYPDEDIQLFDIEMLDDLKGFIGVLNWNGLNDDFGFLKTEDGGNTWTLSNLGMTRVTNISFVNCETGYCLGMLGPEGGLLKTIDGGETWTFIVNGIGGNTINCLQFINEQTGFYAGWEAAFDEGKISKTEDEGVTWQDQVSGRFWDMDMINVDTGYALTWDGKIYKTTNGGWVGIMGNTKKTNYFDIFPNPFNTKLFLKFHGQTNDINKTLIIELFNTIGQLVYSNKLDYSKTNTVYLKNSKQGFYYYTIRNHKLIIQAGKVYKK